MKKQITLSNFAILYFTIGFVVAILFALYYRWPLLSYLSPGFYSVILTWPFQLIGFIQDLLIYGLAGKTLI